MMPYDDDIVQYMDGSAGPPSPRADDRSLPEESNSDELFTECVRPLLGYLRSCACFSRPSSAKTSMFFSILLLISITLNLIGDPFDPTAKKAVINDEQSILGEEWSAHQAAVRAEIEQQRKEWEEEQKEMQKRLRESQVRDRERLQLEKERKGWEKEKSKRQKLKNKFEAEMKQSERKWEEEKDKNERSRNDL